MNHALRCRYGTLQGEVEATSAANRVVCYCSDCQAYAHFLGRAADVLDAHGGTEVVATLPRHVRFSAGTDALACMSLSDGGLLRWYARCCNTPVGNTPRSMKASYVGLVHSCLDQQPLAPSFGPVRLRVGVKTAKARVDGTPMLATVAVMARFVKLLLGARLDGSYRRTPFFDAASGAPVRSPQVLTPPERQRLARQL